MSVESETNILYVNINFTGNLLLGFGRYCGKVLPEPAVFQKGVCVYVFFIKKGVILDQTYSFKNKELTITKKVSPFCTVVFCETFYKKSFKSNKQALLGLALREHENLLFLLISLLVHHQKSPDTLLLI